MELYWKAAAAVLIALVLGQAVREKDMSLLLSMAVCAMVGMLLITYLEPVLEFLQQLRDLGDLQGNMLGILMKVLGIGIVTEITDMVCRDSGNASLGHALQILGTAVILWLSLPIFTTLIQMIQRILGEI